MRRQHRLSMVPQLPSRATVCRQGVAAEDHAVLVRLDGEDAQVEQLVVQSTQRQPIGLDVRPANVMPLDVCRFKPGRHMTDAQVKATDTAAPLVGAHDLLPERRVTASAHLGVERILRGVTCLGYRRQVQSGGCSDIGMKRVGKVGVEELLGRLLQQRGLVSERVEDVGAEARLDARPSKLTEIGCRAVRS